MAVQVNVTIDFGEAARQLAAFQQELGAALVSESNQAEQAFQQVASQAAQNVQRQAAQITQGVQTATQGATQAARTAGKNMTEEFLRAFDPDKIRAELESAGLDQQQIDIIVETTQARAETQKLKDAIAGAFGEASDIASESLKQITAQAAREVDRSKGKVKSVTEIVDGVRELTSEVKKLDGAGGEAAESLSMLVLNETVDKFGDLKDIFEKTGVALLGLSQDTVDAAVKIADIAEKGALVGAAFGPMGAAIGLVAGGVLGAFNASAEAAAKQAQELADRINESTTNIQAIATAAGEGGLSIDALTAKQAELSKELSTKVYPAVAQYEIALKGAQQATESLAQQEATLAAEQEGNAQAGSELAVVSDQLRLAREIQRKATEDLATAEKSLAAAKEASLVLDFALGQSAEETIKTLSERYETLTKGDKFARLSTKELAAEVEKLDKRYNEAAASAKSLSEKSFLKGEGGAAAADAAKEAVAAFEELSKATAILETRQKSQTAASKSSTAATNEDTKAKEDNIKAIQSQVRALFDAESIADKLASKTKLAEDAFVIEPKLKIPPLDKEDMLLALPSLDFASFVDITKYIEQFEDFAVEIQDIFREQFEDKALNLSVAIDPESQKQAEKDLQDVIKNAEQVEKQRQERADYAIKIANERRQKEAEDALAQAEQLLRPLEDVTLTIFDTMLENIALGKSAFADLGAAIRDSIFNALKAIGKEYAVKAIGETAQGLAALAIGGPFGAKSASEHFAAAASFAAAAVAAGVGAAAVGAGSKAAIPGGGGGSASLGGAGGGGSPSLGAAANGASNQPTAAVVVDFRGAMFPTSDLRAAQEFGAAVAGYIDSAYKGGAISSRPRVGR